MDSSRLNGNSFFLCNEAIYRLKTDHIFANLGADTPSEDKNYLTIPVRAGNSIMGQAFVDSGCTFNAIKEYHWEPSSEPSLEKWVAVEQFP